MSAIKRRVLSGIRPTGNLHIGNYLGAVRQFVEMQAEQNECFFFVADLHALTTADEFCNVRALTLEVIRSYLACGIDPQKSVMYCQSSVPYIPYLSTLLGMLTSEALLRRCTTYKDKVSKQEVPSLGLLGYPVLMAADILIVNADVVPVGNDQLQHLEMARDIAAKFNARFGDILALPSARMVQAIRVPGLDGSGKMGKSEGNTIGLFEEPSAVKKKIMSAVTDAGPVKGQPMGQEMKNLYYLLELFSPREVTEDYLQRYADGEQKFYGELKKQLAADIINTLAPFREKYHQPECSTATAEDVLLEGERRVMPIAKEVFTKVYEKFTLFSKTPTF